MLTPDNALQCTHRCLCLTIQFPSLRTLLNQFLMRFFKHGVFEGCCAFGHCAANCDLGWVSAQTQILPVCLNCSFRVLAPSIMLWGKRASMIFSDKEPVATDPLLQLKSMIRSVGAV